MWERSSEIGQTIAILLDQAGCHITFSYRKKQKKHRRKEIAYITGQTLFVNGELTSYADFREAWSV